MCNCSGVEMCNSIKTCGCDKLVSYMQYVDIKHAIGKITMSHNTNDEYLFF